jgi:hypothetical protein
MANTTDSCAVEVFPRISGDQTAATDRSEEFDGQLELHGLQIHPSELWQSELRTKSSRRLGRPLV